MLFFTSLGDMGTIWILLALMFLLSKKHRMLGVMLAIGLILELIIGNGILKHIFARPRPCWLDKSVKVLVEVPKDYSFPSAHAFSSFICATIITKYRKKWGIWVIPLATLISVSRVYLFVHFPSDVIAGAILGIIMGSIVYSLMYKHFWEKKIQDFVSNRESCKQKKSKWIINSDFNL